MAYGGLDVAELAQKRPRQFREDRASDDMDPYRVRKGTVMSKPASESAGPTLNVTPTPPGVWVRIEDFRGNPEGDPLVWWWNKRGTEKMATDEALLDGDGLIIGKGMCGMYYYTHVMLAELPDPPPNPDDDASLPTIDDVRGILA